MGAGFKTFVRGPLASDDVNNYLMKQATAAVTSATRPSAPEPGMRIHQTDTNDYWRWDPTATGGGQWVPDPLVLHYRGTKTLTGVVAGTVAGTGAMPDAPSPYGNWTGVTGGHEVNGIIVPIAGYYDVSFTAKAPAVSPGGRGFVQVTRFVQATNTSETVMTGNGARSSFGDGEDTTTATAVDMHMSAGDTLLCTIYLATPGDVNLVLTARLSRTQ